MPRVTLDGMYRAYQRLYYTGDNDGFWDQLQLPDALDPYTVGNAIIYNSGDLYPYIQDMPNFVMAFWRWSGYRKAEWQRMLDALTATYNPIENYDRHESGSETLEKHKGSVVTDEVAETGSEDLARHKGTKTSVNESTTETPRVKTKTEGSVVAFDASTPTLADQTITTPIEGTNTRTANAADNYTIVQDVDASTYDHDTTTFTDRKTTRTIESADKSATVFDKDVTTFDDRHTHGNIGVTKTQDMILSELELRKLSIIDIIVAEFEDKFLVQIY